jgi:hypothetical protein
MSSLPGWLVLEPSFEADFEPCSYGFRPKRRAQDAIAEIHHFGTQGYRWVLDADIEAASGNVSHSAVMGRAPAQPSTRDEAGPRKRPTHPPGGLRRTLSPPTGTYRDQADQPQARPPERAVAPASATCRRR